jgi:probable HAF family extracellular repeat protein
VKSILATFVVIAVSLCRAQAQSSYTITDLGNFGGFSFASGINSSGQVSGESSNADAYSEGFIYSNGTLAALPNVTLPQGATGVNYEATAINSSGQAAGYSSYSLSGSQQYKSFTYSSGVSTAVSGIDIANGINNAGNVVGYTFTDYSTRAAFLNTNGVVTNLGNLGFGGESSYTVANGINNAGQVVGAGTTASYAEHAFIWTAAGGMTDLGTLGGLSSIAWAINDNGQVVGSSSTSSSSTHAFLWSAAGGMIDLGTLGGATSRANALNDNAQVVGESLTASDSEDATIWENGQAFDLNNLIGPDSGYVLNDATGINDAGQIVVDATETSDSANVALLLNPIEVPEPSTFAFFGLFSGVLAISYRLNRGTGMNGLKAIQ